MENHPGKQYHHITHGSSLVSNLLLRILANIVVRKSGHVTPQSRPSDRSVDGLDRAKSGHFANKPLTFLRIIPMSKKRARPPGSQSIAGAGAPEQQWVARAAMTHPSKAHAEEEGRDEEGAAAKCKLRDRQRKRIGGRRKGWHQRVPATALSEEGDAYLCVGL
jgi:hypothetical protein